VSKLDTIGHHLAVMEKYRRLLRRHPDSLLFAELADQLRRAGKLSEATAICSRGLLRHPDYATGHVVMGEIFRDAGMTQKAEEHWREALRLDPRHPRAHFCLGELHLGRGEADQAIAAFEAAVFSSPEFAEAHARLAEVRKRAADQQPEELEPPAPGPAWRTAERPGWLTSGRFEELVAAVASCRSVEAAAMVNSEGLLLAAGTPSAARPQESAVMAAEGAELVMEARDLLTRLGAGRLLGALVWGGEGSLRCLALGNLTLVATLKPGLPVGAAEAEIEEALASLNTDTSYEQARDG